MTWCDDLDKSVPNHKWRYVLTPQEEGLAHIDGLPQ